MPRSRKSRRRLSTPSLKLAQPPKEDYQQPHTDPTSPPETPTTSPPTSRKISLKPRHQPEFRDMFEPLARDPNIRPVGNGHQFSYQPSLGPEQLSPRSSPRSSASSSDPSEDSTDDPMSDSPSIASLHYQPDATMSEDGDDEESDVELSEADSSSHSPGSEPSEAEEISGFTTATSVPCNFIIEDIDPMDSDCEGLEVLHPTEIESNRSRSRSRHKDHLDSGMMHDLRNLNCSNEPSDHEGNEGGQEGDYECDQDAVYHRSKQIRKFRRMSMGSSFGKRTHSELSDSDDDGEALDVNDVGSSARRMRRKMHRTSLLFHDPPPARIEELEEPDSSEDEFGPGHHLARELPYWAMEIMEMDSS